MSLLSRLRHPELHGIALYGLATGFAALLTLVQTRVLWHVVTPVDFGLWSLIDPMLLPAASLVLFGIDHAIVKQLRVNCLSVQVVTGTLLASTLPASAACMVIVGLVASLAFHLAWTDALLLTMTGEALILMMQSAFRATGAVKLFAALLLSRNLLYLVALLVAQVLQAAGPLPIRLIFLIRGACVLLVSLVALAVLRPALQIDWVRYRDALRYGSPLLLTTFIYALTDLTDRWFLADFTGVVAVGVYSLHLKVAAILSQAIVIPFGLWFPPERFKHLDDPDGGTSFFIATAMVLAVVCSYLSGAVWLARSQVLPLIAPGVVASPLVLACCLAGVVCLAMSQALGVGLLLPGHTTKSAAAFAYSAVVTGLTSITLVPLYHMTGAALSRILTGIFLVAIISTWSNRVFYIPFPRLGMIFLFGAASLILFIIDSLLSSSSLLCVATKLVIWSIITTTFVVAYSLNTRRRHRQVKRAQGSGFDSEVVCDLPTIADNKELR